ncbi:odorant receptor 131-2-like [Lethenteron reissneri]|uniref:odorant receptor 131-2-like n=1 Tax=Lethenteron reissneri TaxID=7753 RepID=UPI002AB5F736|nr:odorant receptor 131-2-like [Lethenteron reissneri]
MMPIGNATASYTATIGSSTVDSRLFYNIFQIFILFMTAPSLCLFFSITITIFIEMKLRENSRYILFANLLACDTFFLLYSTIMATLIWLQTNLSLTSCNVNTMVSTILNQSGVMCVTLMSVERYVAICHPFHHPRWFSHRKTLQFLAVIWSIASVFPLASGILVFTSGVTVNNTRTCSSYLTDSLMPNPMAIAVLREFPNAVIFTVCIIALIFTYFNIMMAARKASDDVSKAKRAKQTVVLHGLQLFLYLCSLGNTLFAILFAKMTSDPNVMTILRLCNYLFLYYSSRFVVPLIYGIRDKQLRQCLRKKITCHYNRVTTF